MPRALLPALFLFCFAAVPLGAQTVVINEIADPEDNVNARFVELFNFGRESISLDGYEIRRYVNGNTSPGQGGTFRFNSDAVIKPGDFYVVSNQRDGFRTAYKCEEDARSFTVNVNGDDVLELFDGQDVVDVYGVIGVDGTGEDWDYENSIVTRRVYEPNGGDFDVDDFDITKGTTANATPCEAPVTFPVELLTFTAEPAPTGALLRWATASETNNDYFAVEHSDDTIEYTEIGRVAARSPLGAAYDFTYPTVRGGVHYFRLRQVDLDGTTDTTGPVAVELAGSGDAFAVLGTVVDDILVVTLAEPQTLRVVASDGRVVAHLPAAAGRSELPVGYLPGGVYVLTDGRTTKRFVHE